MNLYWHGPWLVVGLLRSGGNFRKWNLIVRGGSLGGDCVLEGYILTPAPLSVSMLSGHHEVSSFAPSHLLCLNVLPHHSPTAMEL